MTDVFDRIAVIVADMFQATINYIQPDTNFKLDLGSDELDDVEMIMAVEEEFDIAIRDDEAMTVETVDDLVKLVESKI